MAEWVGGWVGRLVGFWVGGLVEEKSCEVQQMEMGACTAFLTNCTSSNALRTSEL